MNLRCEVHASAETAILRINELTDSIISEINKYENESVNSFQLTNPGSKLVQKQDFIKTIKQVDKFYKDESIHLNDLKYDEEDLAKKNLMALNLKRKASEDVIKIKSFVFGDKFIRFEKKHMKIEMDTFGLIKYSQISTLRFADSINAKNVLKKALLESIVFDRVESGEIHIFYLENDIKTMQFLKVNDLNVSSEIHSENQNFSNTFKKYKDLILFSDPHGSVHILDSNFKIIFSTEDNLTEPALICMNNDNVFCLLLDQHNLLVHNRFDKNLTRRIRYQSTNSYEPFYFPSDIKQFECANGKFIWLNDTKLQILDETTGKFINSIEVVADKFILDSKNNIFLLNHIFQRIQIYQNDGVLLREYRVQENLVDQPFFLDRGDKIIFFNKNLFEYYLQKLNN